MADDKNPSTSVTEKKFKSKLHAFPVEVLTGIDECIAKGLKADRIREYIVRVYRGPLDIPNRKTVADYVKNRAKTAVERSKKSVQLNQDLLYTKQELLDLQRRLDLPGTDPYDAKSILKKMISFTLNRIQLNVELQEGLLDPRVENNIIKLIESVGELNSKMVELENKLGAYEAVSRLIIEKFFVEFVPVMRRASEDVHGSAKTKELIERLQKGYKSIDMARIINEANAEVKTMEKEQLGVKKIGSNAA